MGDLIKWIFSSTVKCVGKCGGEWVDSSFLLNQARWTAASTRLVSFFHESMCVYMCVCVCPQGHK